MPCYTRVTVEVKDFDIAKKAAEVLKFDADTYIANMSNKVLVNLPTYVTRSQFKTEYGLLLAETRARKTYGSRARIWRTAGTNKTTLNVKI